jgi:hypothetical protein
MVNAFFTFVMLRKSTDRFGGVDPTRSAPVHI